MAAVDINNARDGDELVVGAPLHSTTDKYDVGKVKIFSFSLNRREKWESKVEVEISPPELTSGSQFGSAVENLGDIHNDGFEDFAVSAPYFGDNKAGAVFIYRGNSEIWKFGKHDMISIFNLRA